MILAETENKCKYFATRIILFKSAHKSSTPIGSASMRHSLEGKRPTPPRIASMKKIQKCHGAPPSQNLTPKKNGGG